MKVSILGYGRMGKEIEKILLRENVEVVARIDNDDEWQAQRAAFESSDVAIEFSTPATAVDNLFRCFAARIPVVCGTTGWHDRTAEVLEQCEKQNGALVYGTNFSIGANLFFKVNEYVAQLMNRQPQYDVTVEETHHTGKKDAPSGTAITIANQIIGQLDRKTCWTLADTSSPANLAIQAHRIGNETGTHEVIYESANDRISLCHKAYDRAIFAEGAVRAALWLPSHKGIFPFNEIFMEL